MAVSADETLQFAPSETGSEPPPLYLSGAFFQLYVTALQAGVLHALLTDAVAHVHQRPRSSAWAPSPSAPDDPLLQRDRHWPNIRTLASANPTSYKAQALGPHYVRGARLSASGYF